jgi:hypothetical protein
MKRATALSILVAVILIAVAVTAQAQQARTMPLIGYLAGAGSSPNQAFVQGMRDLGYVEGKNIAFAYRTTEGRSERNTELAVELVSLKVDVIYRGWYGSGPGCKKSHEHDPHCDGDQHRSCWKRTRGELGAARRQRHRVDKRRRRARRKVAGTA